MQDIKKVAAVLASPAAKTGKAAKQAALHKATRIDPLEPAEIANMREQVNAAVAVCGAEADGTVRIRAEEVMERLGMLRHMVEDAFIPMIAAILAEEAKHPQAARVLRSAMGTQAYRLALTERDKKATGVASRIRAQAEFKVSCDQCAGQHLAQSCHAKWHTETGASLTGPGGQSANPAVDKSGGSKSKGKK